MDLNNEDLFNINTAFMFQSNSKYPLAEMRDTLTHISIVTLEEFLSKHNPNMDKFSLNELSLKLGKNCTNYKHLSSGDEQVSSGHIKEKICRHFTLSSDKFNRSVNKNYDSIFSNKSNGIVIPEHLRKYRIYFAYDNRDITSYASEKTLKTIRKSGSKRRKKLKARFTYDNPLNRIHGLLIIEDNACHSCMESSKNTKISVICANPFASKNGMKAVGAYLKMFYLIRAHLMDNDRAILEVTNNKADIDPDDSDSSDDEDDSGDDEDDSGNDEDDDDEDDDLYDSITELREYFEEVRQKAYDMVKKEGYKLTDGYDYWVQIKNDFEDDLYLDNDSFLYRWKTDWIEKRFNPTDKSLDYEWPNGLNIKPRGAAKPTHFYNQLKRIPLLNEVVSPQDIIKIALNLGQAEAHGIIEKDKFDFYDYVRVIDMEDEGAEDECCNISIDHNINCIQYKLDDDDDDDLDDLDNYESRKSFLESKSIKMLCELKQCYGLKKPGNKETIVKAILNHEFWRYDIYENNHVDCNTEWSYEDYYKKRGIYDEDYEDEDDEDAEDDDEDAEDDDEDAEDDDDDDDDDEMPELEEIDICDNLPYEEDNDDAEDDEDVEDDEDDEDDDEDAEDDDDDEDDEDDEDNDDDDDDEPFNLEKYKYGGIKYLKGKNQHPDLYCAFYEKHGFRENPELNTKYKCFDIDPLPSMEIKLKGEDHDSIHDLIKVFTERKPLKKLSEFCKSYDKGDYVK